MSLLADAYAVLGLSHESSLEQVKAKYKQVALRTHPDKNPENPNATIEFQRVSEAYRVLLGHLDTDEDGSDDIFWEDDDYEDEDDIRIEVRQLFSRIMNDRRHCGSGCSHFPRPESREDYREQLKRRMKERREAEARQQKENDVRKEYEKKQREREQQEAEERQKRKKEAKKVQAKAKNKKAAQTAQMLQERAQARRSSVFQAAREGDVAKVKEGIYEFSVDASGGEVRTGCEKFVKVLPEDPQETLLHITIKKGDAGLVEYLDRHNAEPDERNSEGLTPVHIAIRMGKVNIVTYYFKTYPPQDPDHQAIYRPPEGQSLLSLGLQSLDFRTVNLILSHDLFNAEDIKWAWTWANSDTSAKESEKLDDILALLMRYGDFTSSSATSSACSNVEMDRTSTSTQDVEDNTTPPKHNDLGTEGKDRERGRGRGRGRERCGGRGR